MESSDQTARLRLPPYILFSEGRGFMGGVFESYLLPALREGEGYNWTGILEESDLL